MKNETFINCIEIHRIGNSSPPHNLEHEKRREKTFLMDVRRFNELIFEHNAININVRTYARTHTSMYACIRIKGDDMRVRARIWAWVRVKINQNNNNNNNRNRKKNRTETRKKKLLLVPTIKFLMVFLALYTYTYILYILRILQIYL